ncbi:MAG: TIGR00282 family metallophosphoesterase [Erysipelotrichaceae bacterium]|nr:TIGR00282 family metallophosphoesterase [Erysipelotrichaceae bacterium]
MIKILFIGDIVGESGRLTVKKHLPALIQKYQPDLIIANGENAAHGKGITPKIFHELLSWGIDVITMGNHTYAKENVYEIINDKRIIRPLNMKPNQEGEGVRYFSIKNQNIGIINIIGQAFMERDVSDPFTALMNVANEDAIYIVDFHGETTSEKALFVWQFSHRLAAIIGTHTHVQTADERIINGCAFISDVGMCGAYDSILGRDIDEVIANVIHKQKTHYTIAEGEGVFSAVLIEIEERRAKSILRIQIRPE